MEVWLRQYHNETRRQLDSGGSLSADEARKLLKMRDNMRIIVHQWRDWLLEFIGDDKYELTRKGNASISHTIMAKNSMDAETEGQRIIQKNNEDDVNSIVQKQ